MELRGTAGSASWPDPITHGERLVQVHPGVRLEVLDWGGSGPPVADLLKLLDRFADAWKQHDLDALMAMMTDGMNAVRIPMHKQHDKRDPVPESNAIARRYTATISRAGWKPYNPGHSRAV